MKRLRVWDSGHGRSYNWTALLLAGIISIELDCLSHSNKNAGSRCKSRDVVTATTTRALANSGSISRRLSSGFIYMRERQSCSKHLNTPLLWQQRYITRHRQDCGSEDDMVPCS
jgi:hypothetical protein